MSKDNYLVSLFLAVPGCCHPPSLSPSSDLFKRNSVFKFTPKYIKIARSLFRKIYSSADNGIAAKSCSPLSLVQLVFTLDLTIAFKPTAKHLESHY